MPERRQAQLGQLGQLGRLGRLGRPVLVVVDVQRDFGDQEFLAVLSHASEVVGLWEQTASPY